VRSCDGLVQSRKLGDSRIHAALRDVESAGRIGVRAVLAEHGTLPANVAGASDNFGSPYDVRHLDVRQFAAQRHSRSESYLMTTRRIPKCDAVAIHQTGAYIYQPLGDPIYVTGRVALSFAAMLGAPVDLRKLRRMSRLRRVGWAPARAGLALGLLTASLHTFCIPLLLLHFMPLSHVRPVEIHRLIVRCECLEVRLVRQPGRLAAPTALSAALAGVDAICNFGLLSLAKKFLRNNSPTLTFSHYSGGV